MAAGRAHQDTGLSGPQRQRITSAIETCRAHNGLDVSVIVGDLVLDGQTTFSHAATQLHAALGTRSATAVLVVVAPGQRQVEIVVGQGLRRRVPDRVCALAVLSMTTAFTGGDLTGGIVDALRQIADSAGRRDSLPALITYGGQLVPTDHEDLAPRVMGR